MMKLHARPASPFARKVRVAAIETGVIENIEIVMAQTPEESRRVVPGHNPLAKIPVLVLEDGTALYDSRGNSLVRPCIVSIYSQITRES